MKIKVSDVSATERVITFGISGGEIEKAFSYREDIACVDAGKSTIGMCRIESTCNLRGAISAPTRFICARCGESFESQLNIRFKLVLTKSDDRDPEDEDEGYGTYEKDEIDLLQISLEQIIEKLPTTLTCSDKCKGLCYICGANLNETECECQR